MSAPVYEHHVFVCQNQREAGHALGCCASKGSAELLEALKAEARRQGLQNVRINKAGCLGQCQLGTAVVVYPQGQWYVRVTSADAPDLITALKEGSCVERLAFIKEPG